MKGFKMNLKALQNGAKKAIEKKLKPIIIKHKDNGCRTCGK